MSGRIGIAAIGSILTLAASASAAVVITTNRYEQHFDLLGTAPSTSYNNFGTAASGTEGWIFATNTGAANPLYKTAQYASPSFGTGTSIERYACVRPNGTGGSDVAMGARLPANAGSAIAIFLRNGTDQTITTVEISSILELWRKPSAIPTASGYLEWGIGSNVNETGPLPWTSINYTHLGMPGFRPTPSDALYSQQTLAASLNDITWNPGDTLAIRWYFPSAFSANGMSTSPVLALDDVVIGFPEVVTPEPGLALMAISITLGALGLRPRRASAAR